MPAVTIEERFPTFHCWGWYWKCPLTAWLLCVLNFFLFLVYSGFFSSSSQVDWLIYLNINAIDILWTQRGDEFCLLLNKLKRKSAMPPIENRVNNILKPISISPMGPPWSLHSIIQNSLFLLSIPRVKISIKAKTVISHHFSVSPPWVPFRVKHTKQQKVSPFQILHTRKLSLWI